MIFSHSNVYLVDEKVEKKMNEAYSSIQSGECNFMFSLENSGFNSKVWLILY